MLVVVVVVVVVKVERGNREGGRRLVRKTWARSPSHDVVTKVMTSVFFYVATSSVEWLLVPSLHPSTHPPRPEK